MSSKQLTEEYKNNVMATMVEYDSLSQAIKFANLNNAEDKDVQTIILMKQNAKDRRVLDEARILKSMNLANNIAHISGPWYAIRHLNEKNNIVLKLDVIVEKDLAILQRDGRRERELSRKDLDNLLPGCIDEVQLELYKGQIAMRAHEYVQDFCGMQLEESAPLEPKVVRPIAVSSHAGMRYVQRKLGIGLSNETVAEDYRRTHLREVEAGVLEGYNSAERVWVSDDGIQFSFDHDNIMYVVGDAGGHPNIVTLYEEEFGFTKDINRMITLQQLEVLAKARESLLDTERELDESLRASEDEVRSLADQIDLLECQIDLLTAQKATTLASRDQHTKVLRVCRSQYSVEYNKLFKKWDS